MTAHALLRGSPGSYWGFAADLRPQDVHRVCQELSVLNHFSSKNREIIFKRLI